MAELKFLAIIDPKQLKKQMEDFFKQRFKVKTEVDEGEGSGKKNKKKKNDDKKQTGLLGGILKALGPIAALLSLKPLVDLLGIGINFILLLVLKVGEFMKKGAIWLNKLESGFRGGLQKLGEFLREKIAKVWGKIVPWLINLWNTFKEKLRETWHKIVAPLVRLKEAIKEKLLEVWNKIIEKLQSVWEGTREKLSEIWSKITEKVGSVWEKTKEKLSEIWSKITEKLSTIWTATKEKFSSVISKLKELPGLLAEKIKVAFNSAISNIKSIFSRDKNNDSGNTSLGDRYSNPVTKVDDAIITKTGKVIKTNPSDTIFATKNPQGMGSNVTNIFNGVTPREMIETIKQQLGQDIRGFGRF